MSELTSIDIERHTLEYLKRGGRITICPPTPEKPKPKRRLYGIPTPGEPPKPHVTAPKGPERLFYKFNQYPNINR